MRDMVINGKVWKIPESWADVQLQRHVDAAKALRDNITKEDAAAGIYPRKAIGVCIAALVGFNESVLLSCDIDTFEELEQTLNFYFTTHPTPRPVTEFELGGLTFQIPSDIQAQTFGEFADMDTAVMENKDDLLAAIPEILAIYCRQQGEPYSHEPEFMETRTNLMRTLDMETAEGLAAFFLTSGQLAKVLTVQFGSRLVSLTYKVRQLESSLKHTAGMLRWLRWPTMIFCVWMRFGIRRLGKS